MSFYTPKLILHTSAQSFIPQLSPSYLSSILHTQSFISPVQCFAPCKYRHCSNNLGYRTLPPTSLKLQNPQKQTNNPSDTHFFALFPQTIDTGQPKKRQLGNKEVCQDSLRKYYFKHRFLIQISSVQLIKL